jgi:hypothetical protein
MRKQKFEIIEEGRLSKNEMYEVVGGAYSCTCKNYTNPYLVTQCSQAGYSSCGGQYTSCTGSSAGQLLSCSNYVGPTGPGGLSGVIPELELSISGRVSEVLQAGCSLSQVE